MKAIVLQEDRTTAVKEKEVPSLEKGEVLVKVRAISLNPTDWKSVDDYGLPGSIVGCDYAGVVEKVGEDVTHVKIGDEIGGVVRGGYYQHNGAFAEYVAGVAGATWKKPKNMSFQEIAPFGIACTTAACGLYDFLGLPTPKNASAESAIPILIWGGSSSVGQFAIQLAKFSKLTVIITASPKNHEYLKSLGADHCFDYRDPDVISKIKEASNNQLSYAFDCVSEKDSFSQCATSIKATGGKVTVLLPYDEKVVKDIRSDIEWSLTVMNAALDQEFNYKGTTFRSSPEQVKFIRTFIVEQLQPMIDEGRIKTNKLKLMTGGLEAVADGMEYMKAGKVSMEKLVYTISE